MRPTGETSGLFIVVKHEPRNRARNPGFKSSVPLNLMGSFRKVKKQLRAGKFMWFNLSCTTSGKKLLHISFLSGKDVNNCKDETVDGCELLRIVSTHIKLS